MKKLRRLFTISFIVLVGCTSIFNPPPTTPGNFPVDQDSTPQNLSIAPTVTPENSVSHPAWDFRIHITTTSDWTTVRLVEGVVVKDYKIQSASQGANTVSFNEGVFQLAQPIEQANSGQSVELVVDLSLDNEPGGADLIIEIDRGYIGETTVEVYHYVCGEPGKVATLTWDGIQQSGGNIERFTIPYSQLTSVPQNEYIVIAQLNFWYYGPGLWGGFENDLGERSTALTPLLGDTYWASDPDVVYQQIEWAAAYGVDAFSIEWTTPRGIGCCGSMEDTLDDVFLKSPNISKVRWAIFYDFPLRLMQTSGLEKYATDFDFDEPKVYSTFVQDFRHFAHKYFGHPQYLTIDDRPVVYIWASNAFQGNVEGALRDARQAVAEKGYDVYIVGDEITANYFDAYHASLFDGNTTFTFLIPGLSHESWADIGDAIPEVDQTFEKWRKNIEGLKVIDRDDYVNFQPAWAPQYDERLGRPNLSNPIYVPATSQDQVFAMAEVARKHAQPAGSQGQKLIWLNTWNCWGETTTVEPTISLGPKYPAGNYHFDMLEVVLEVFGAETYTCGSP
jgi:hypothetical protein